MVVVVIFGIFEGKRKQEAGGGVVCDTCKQIKHKTKDANDDNPSATPEHPHKNKTVSSTRLQAFVLSGKRGR